MREQCRNPSDPTRSARRTGVRGAGGPGRFRCRRPALEQGPHPLGFGADRDQRSPRLARCARRDGRCHRADRRLPRRVPRRRAHRRRGDGHGRIEPVPRGHRPFLPEHRSRPAPPRPGQHRSGGGGPHRRPPARRHHLVPGLVEVRIDHRDPQPPRLLLGPGRPRRPLRRGDRPRFGAGPAGSRARLPPRVREPPRHRRPVLRAQLLRLGPRGARRRRLAGPGGRRPAGHPLAPGGRPRGQRRSPPRRRRWPLPSAPAATR